MNTWWVVIVWAVLVPVAAVVGELLSPGDGDTLDNVGMAFFWPMVLAGGAVLALFLTVGEIGKRGGEAIRRWRA